MSALSKSLHCRNCKKLDITSGLGGYCEKCLYFVKNQGGTIKVNNFCADCGVKISLSALRCAGCGDARRARPLVNNCGICGKNPIVTAKGVCASCYESPLAPRASALLVCTKCSKDAAILNDEGHCNSCQRNTPCEKCGSNVPSGLALCWPCHQKPLRPSWDDYFFEMAKLVSTRATCPRASVGVVLVDGSHRVIATGYNGAASGESHCIDVGCDVFAGHCQRARHGEENAVDAAWATLMKYAAYSRDEYPDFLQEYNVTAYVSAPLPVCTACSRVLRRAGVVDVKWRESK